MILGGLLFYLSPWQFLPLSAIIIRNGKTMEKKDFSTEFKN
jgi:hypothetical protein